MVSIWFLVGAVAAGVLASMVFLFLWLGAESRRIDYTVKFAIAEEARRTLADKLRKTCIERDRLKRALKAERRRHD